MSLQTLILCLVMFCSLARAANVQPLVTITGPTNGSVFVVPGVVPLRVNASDSDGSVVEVRYFAYGLYVGRSTNSPFSFDWRNVASGAYCMRAVAIDNLGATRNSADVCLIITNESSSVPKYFLTDLGTLGGPSSQAAAINSSGVVAGYAKVPSNRDHPFVFTNGLLKDLNTISGDGGYGLGINDGGRVVGYYSPSVGNIRATVWNGTNRTDLGTLGGNTSLAFSINSAGQIVGYAETNTGIGRNHAFLHSGGVMRDLGTLGGLESFAYAINDSGLVTGYSYLTNIGSRAFIYDITNGMRALPTLGGNQCQSRAINPLGQVAGGSEGPSGQLHAFWYHDGFMEDLFVPYNTSTSQALGLNDAGQIVGICDSGSSSSKAFFWQNGLIHNLNSTITNTDWELRSADAINQRGQIVGYGAKGLSSERRAFLLTPAQPPVVRLIAPTNIAPYFGPTNLTLMAVASDPDDAVRRVEFFANGLRIAAVTNAPYVQTWSNVLGGTYVLTVVATDLRDLSSTSAPVNITVVVPNQPPTFSPGPDQSVAEDSGPQTVVGWAANISAGAAGETNQLLAFIVTNNAPNLFVVAPTIDPDGTLTFTPASNAFGTSTVSVVLVDDGGTANGGTDTSTERFFEIRVLPIDDPPVARAGDDQVLACSGATTSVLLNGSASEELDGDTLIFAWREGGTLLGTNVQLLIRLGAGIHLITLEVTDGTGNSALDSLMVSIVDNAPPVITCPASRVVEAGTAWDFAEPTAADACDGTNVVVVTISTVTNSVNGCAFVATRSWEAVDGTGHRAACSETVSVVDTTPPEFVCPTNFTLDASAPAGAVVVFTNMLAADCLSEVIIESVPSSGSVFPLGTNFVTWTATDLSGNSNTCDLLVVVLGPRGILEDMLAKLVSVQAGVTNRAEQRRLSRAIAYLAQTTNSAFWIDDQHLRPATARGVFQESKLAADRVRSILVSRVVPRGPVPLPDSLVFGWMARLANANRLLAEFAVQEAEELGGDTRQIAACRKLIARGNAAAVTHQTPAAITQYQEAWRRAEKIRVDQRR